MIKWDLIWTYFDFVLSLCNFSLTSKDYNNVFPNINGWTSKRIRHLKGLNINLFPSQGVLHKVNLKTIKMYPSSISSKHYQFCVFCKQECIFSWDRWLTKYSFSLPIAHLWEHLVKDLLFLLCVCDSVHILSLIHIWRCRRAI